MQKIDKYFMETPKSSRIQEVLDAEVLQTCILADGKPNGSAGWLNQSFPVFLQYGAYSSTQNSPAGM